ncbi:MAG: glycosyltransferase family 87 protein [Candidatus Omnitrophica bacterium]|nr:glycosyltransferase family 87 protein [Candidatus Omnitrophota bacterium]
MKVRITKKVFVVLVVCVLVGFGVYHDMRTVSGSNDLDTYYTAGKFMREGVTVYRAEVFSTTVSPYLYLPLFAILVSPLTLLSLRVASLVWYLLGLSFFIMSFLITVRLVSGTFDWRGIFSRRSLILNIISVLFIFSALLDNISLAQVDFMIYFLIVLSLYAHEKHRDLWAGIIIAAAGVIKIYPLFLLLYFTFKGKVRIIAGALIGIFLFVFAVPVACMGVDRFRSEMGDWARMKMAPYARPPAKRLEDNYTHFESLCKLSNQSLSAVLARYLTDYYYDPKADIEDIDEWVGNNIKHKIPFPVKLPPYQVEVATKFISLMILLVSFSAVVMGRKRSSRESTSVEYAVMLLCMILLFPVVQTHLLASMVFPVLAFNTVRGKMPEKVERVADIVFIIAFLLYALQADRFMKSLGSGAMSVLVMWVLFVFLSLRGVGPGLSAEEPPA